MQEIFIYSDGACKGNPGPGGWGAVLLYQDKKKEIYGGCAQTTNNRMEMTAIIQALQILKKACRIQLYTDSQYVMNGITKWLPVWQKQGWRTSDKKPVKNLDLWLQLKTLVDAHEIHWHWVRGHNGDSGNERADTLACLGAAKIMHNSSSSPQ